MNWTERDLERYRRIAVFPRVPGRGVWTAARHYSRPELGEDDHGELKVGTAEWDDGVIRVYRDWVTSRSGWGDERRNKAAEAELEGLINPRYNLPEHGGWARVFMMADWSDVVEALWAQWPDNINRQSSDRGHSSAWCN